MKSEILENWLKKGGSIHIKKKNRGKFTDYCGGNVTQACINKAKASGNSTLKKRAIFAENARKWKHLNGGVIQNPYSYFLDNKELVHKMQDGGVLSDDWESINKEKDKVDYDWIINNPFDPTNLVLYPDYSNIYNLKKTKDVKDKEEETTKVPFLLKIKDYEIPHTVWGKSNDMHVSKGNKDLGANNDLVNKVFNFFLDKGLTKELASGFVGNFLSESGLNSNAVNKQEKNSGLRGYGGGIAQWSDSRAKDFNRYTGIKAEDATLDQLLEFVWHEMLLRKALMEALKGVTTPEQSAELAYRGFENGSLYKLATPENLQKVYSESWDKLREKYPNYPIYDYNELVRKRALKSLQALRVFLA